MAARRRKQPRVVKTKAELARRLKCTRQAVYGWLLKGMPKRKDGYHVERCAQWVRKMRQRGRAAAAAKRRARVVPAAVDLGGGVSRDVEAQQADTEWRKLRTEHMAHDLRVKRGEMVVRADVEQMFAVRMSTLKRRLQSLARVVSIQAAGLTDPNEVLQLLNEQHDALLWELYGKPPRQYRSDSDDETSNLV